MWRDVRTGLYVPNVNGRNWSTLHGEEKKLSFFTVPETVSTVYTSYCSTSTNIFCTTTTMISLPKQIAHGRPSAVRRRQQAACTASQDLVKCTLIIQRRGPVCIGALRCGRNRSRTCYHDIYLHESLHCCLATGISAVICGGEREPEDGPVRPKHVVINQILRREQTVLKVL